MNVLIDEIRVPEEHRSRAPRFVSFALTNACDLACRFCYAPKYPASLDFSQVVNWSHELDLNGTLGVGFGGGEPTLYPRFADLCTALHETTGLAVSFTTHGHRLTPGLCDNLKGTVNYIRVSVDGLGTTYERIRGRPFSILLKQLELVSGVCSFGINYVINDETVSHLDDLARMAQDLGAAEMLLLPEISRRGISDETRQSLLEWITGKPSPLRLSISERGVIDGIPLANPFATEMGLMAYAHVSADGAVSRTSFDRSKAVTINPRFGLLAAIAKCEENDS